MIIGIGNDIVNIDRIKNAIDKFGDRFIERVFTHEERLKANSSALRAAAYAKRFAAKEAAWKALGDGQRLGIKWTELSVLNEKSGKPILRLTGNAAEILNNLIPLGMVSRLDLSLSDELPVAQAFVVISAELVEHATLRK